MDYTDWKILKSTIQYIGDDVDKIALAQKAQLEYEDVVFWCENNNEYTIEDDGIYYKVVEKQPYVPTHEDIKQMRIAYRREHIDDQTSERSRKQANNTWTTEDEAAYLALDAEVTAWIEENLPYTDNADDEVA